jgi:hypothetical protein
MRMPAHAWLRHTLPTLHTAHAAPPLPQLSFELPEVQLWFCVQQPVQPRQGSEQSGSQLQLGSHADVVLQVQVAPPVTQAPALQLSPGSQPPVAVQPQPSVPGVHGPPPSPDGR